jgi:mercuric ion transport protein
MISQSDAPKRAGETPAGKEESWLGLVVAGGIVGAIAASSCCILPLVLFALGAGGAWVANLTALAPYQPIFVIVTLGLLGYGFWTVYRRPVCAAGDTCAQPVSDRLLKIGLWAATFCIAAALVFPFVAPALLGT